MNEPHSTYAYAFYPPNNASLEGGRSPKPIYCGTEAKQLLLSPHSLYLENPTQPPVLPMGPGDTPQPPLPPVPVPPDGRIRAMLVQTPIPPLQRPFPYLLAVHPPLPKPPQLLLFPHAYWLHPTSLGPSSAPHYDLGMPGQFQPQYSLPNMPITSVPSYGPGEYLQPPYLRLGDILPRVSRYLPYQMQHPQYPPDGRYYSSHVDAGYYGGKQKRYRRKFHEIHRVFHCTYPDCNKLYGKLNHLNTHIMAQKHGEKKTTEEYRTMMRQIQEQEGTKLRPGGSAVQPLQYPATGPPHAYPLLMSYPNGSSSLGSLGTPPGTSTAPSSLPAPPLYTPLSGSLELSYMPSSTSYQDTSALFDRNFNGEAFTKQDSSVQQPFYSLVVSASDKAKRE